MCENERFQLQRTLKRLRETKRNEGICLMGWQAEQLVKYIDDLKRRVEKDGSSEVQTGNRTSDHDNGGNR